MKNSDKPITPLQHEGFPSSENAVKENELIGLTKREYFAGLAMQGLLNNYLAHKMYGNQESYPMVAEQSIRLADELLTQLENNKP